MSNTTTINTLSETTKLPSRDSARWSARLTDRYGFELSGDLADWFDCEVWRRVGTREYREPVEPSALLADAPESIWPGLMPCDLLPVIGNTAGDWLCIRVDQNNRASEVVQWYHGGGDWLPWGRSIGDALFFDALSDRLPSPARRYAVPAEEVHGGESTGDDPLLAWASDHVEKEIVGLLDATIRHEEVAATLLRHHVSEIAVRCELVQSALKETLSATLDPNTARQLGVDWNEVVQWMFDTERMPAATRRRLERDYGLTISKPQDWESAERHCQRVVELAPDLAWGWDVIGYAAERRGDSQTARDAYRRAVTCSVFTDQSVRIRTHWTAEDAAKFSASRLQEVDPDFVQASPYVQILCQDESSDRRLQLTDYWLGLAEESSAAGDWSAAHQNFYAAGWDLGADPMSSYGRLLERIADAADRSGQVARAELARTHRECLQQRYGI